MSPKRKSRSQPKAHGPSKAATSPKVLHSAGPKDAAPQSQPPKTCFVLIPYSYPFDQLYTRTILPAVRAVHLHCLKADCGPTSPVILGNIWNGIQRATIVIAELTSANSNVIYELGLAHASGKPVLLLCGRGQDVPTDLKGADFFYYEKETEAELHRRLCERLNHLVSNPQDALFEAFAGQVLDKSLELRAAYDLACDGLTNEYPMEAALTDMISVLQGCTAVSAYCGGKGNYAFKYYADQFNWLEGNRGLMLRRMFRRVPNNLDIPDEEILAVVLHAEAKSDRSLPIHIRWHESKTLKKGDGLTLAGSHLLVHHELKTAKMTPLSELTMFSDSLVACVGRAYDRAWLHARTVLPSDVAKLRAMVREREKQPKHRMIQLVALAREAGFEMEWLKPPAADAKSATSEGGDS